MHSLSTRETVLKRKGKAGGGQMLSLSSFQRNSLLDSNIKYVNTNAKKHQKVEIKLEDWASTLWLCFNCQKQCFPKKKTFLSKCLRLNWKNQTGLLNLTICYFFLLLLSFIASFVQKYLESTDLCTTNEIFVTKNYIESNILNTPAEESTFNQLVIQWGHSRKTGRKWLKYDYKKDNL